MRLIYNKYLKVDKVIVILCERLTDAFRQQIQKSYLSIPRVMLRLTATSAITHTT
jgi:hypothetical protein